LTAYNYLKTSVFAASLCTSKTKLLGGQNIPGAPNLADPGDPSLLKIPTNQWVMRF